MWHCVNCGKANIGHLSRRLIITPRTLEVRSGLFSIIQTSYYYMPQLTQMTQRPRFNALQWHAPRYTLTQLTHNITKPFIINELRVIQTADRWAERQTKINARTRTRDQGINRAHTRAHIRAHIRARARAEKPDRRPPKPTPPPPTRARVGVP